VPRERAVSGRPAAVVAGGEPGPSEGATQRAQLFDRPEEPVAPGGLWARREDR